MSIDNATPEQWDELRRPSDLSADVRRMRLERVAADVTMARDGSPIKQGGEYTGGSVNYYKVKVSNPTSGGDSYTAECNDIIEALRLNYAEGNILKAVWRIAAARMGKAKRGYEDEVYDAEKIVFFGSRKLEQVKK